MVFVEVSILEAAAQHGYFPSYHHEPTDSGRNIEVARSTVRVHCSEASKCSLTDITQVRTIILISQSTFSASKQYLQACVPVSAHASRIWLPASGGQR